jgi:hypothetical protein
VQFERKDSLIAQRELNWPAAGQSKFIGGDDRPIFSVERTRDRLEILVQYSSPSESLSPFFVWLVCSEARRIFDSSVQYDCESMKLIFFGNLQIEDDEMKFNGLFIGEWDSKKCRPRDDAAR